MAMLKRHRILAFVWAAVLLALTEVSAQPPAPPTPPKDCLPAAGVQYVCAQRSPEDLILLPGGQWVVAGAFSGAGGIFVIRTADKTSTLAYPSSTASARFDAKTYAGCPGPPDAAAQAKFQTHGLSLQTGANGVHRLFAVLHGPRESVEVFELDARKGMPSLTWIGCAVAPLPIGLNSVRWLADGGFVATNFNPRGAGPDAFKRLQAGERNGEAWEWHTASGWQKVPGSEASGANGIEISDDGRTLYVAAWGTQSLFRLSRGQATPARDEVKLGFNVDNIRWAADGTLIATGQDLAKGLFVVAKVDPKTLALREVLRRANTPAFGNGTVAVEAGKELWVGTFQGDRLAIFPLPK
jgi:hypothetical protein